MDVVAQFSLVIGIFFVFIKILFLFMGGHNAKNSTIRRIHRKYCVDFLIYFVKNKKERSFVFHTNYRYFLFSLFFMTLFWTLIFTRFFNNHNNLGIVVIFFFSIFVFGLIFRGNKKCIYNTNLVKKINALGYSKSIYWNDVVKIWIRSDGYTISSLNDNIQIDIVKPPFQNAIPIPGIGFIECSPLDLQDSKKEIERGMKLFERYARKKTSRTGHSMVNLKQSCLSCRCA